MKPKPHSYADNFSLSGLLGPVIPDKKCKTYDIDRAIIINTKIGKYSDNPF